MSRLERVFLEHNISTVIHFAGYKSVKESVQKPLLYYRNNIGTILAVLQTMKKHGVSRKDHI
jgi:UDP-glucose 4-epimerase